MKRALFFFIVIFSLGLNAQPDPFRQNDYRQEIIEREATKQMDGCESALTNTEGSKYQAIRNVLKKCKFRSIDPDSVIWSRVASAGKSKGFSQSVEAHRKKIQEEQQRQMQPDEVDKITKFVRFDQVVPTNVTTSASVLGEQGVNLSSNVTEIMLYLQRSDDLASYAGRTDHDPKGPGVQELMELAFLAEVAADPNHNCRQVLSFSQLAEGDPEARAIMWNAKGRDMMGDRVPPLQLFFGLKEEDDLKKLDAFRWQKDGKFFYLFKNKSPEGERWVLGEYSPASGEMKLRHYRIVPREQTVKISDGLVSLPKADVSTRIQEGQESTELSGQVGFSVDSYREDLPWGGEVTLPTGSVTISQMKMVKVSETLYTESTMKVQHDGVRMTTDVAPTQNSTWQASINGHKRLEDGGWSVGSQVRVENFVAGYNRDSQGNLNRSIAVMGDNDYVQYETNSVDSRRVTYGRTFGNERQGAITFSTDLEKKSHEIQLVIFF